MPLNAHQDEPHHAILTPVDAAHNVYQREAENFAAAQFLIEDVLTQEPKHQSIPMQTLLHETQNRIIARLGSDPNTLDNTIQIFAAVRNLPDPLDPMTLRALKVECFDRHLPSQLVEVSQLIDMQPQRYPELLAIVNNVRRVMRVLYQGED